MCHRFRFAVLDVMRYALGPSEKLALYCVDAALASEAPAIESHGIKPNGFFTIQQIPSRVPLAFQHPMHLVHLSQAYHLLMSS